jgi:hypothetical protein
VTGGPAVEVDETAAGLVAGAASRDRGRQPDGWSRGEEGDKLPCD